MRMVVMHSGSTVAWVPDRSPVDPAGFPVRAFGACLVVPGGFPSGSRRILRRQGYRDRVDELADSGGLAGDPAALRARLAADGYVFLRGLLPAEKIRAAGELVAAKLRSGGWTAAGSPGPGRGGPREALADPAYRAAVMSLAFNALPYLAPLRGTVRRILGAQAFSYPVKVLRAVGPEVPAQRPRGRYIHCDYMGSGVQDMLTTWIPLAEVPAPLGGLAVRPAVTGTGPGARAR